jgi:uncharacterized protein (TIGR02001 family)
MKKLTRLLTVLFVALGGLGIAKVATAEVSYNVGYVSEYYFRGILQKSSSASAGIDYEENGFYLGAWGADVGDGIEVDIYLGYGIETEAGFTASLGYTTYQYTGDTFDDEYNEVNVNLGYQMLGFEYSTGTCECFGESSDYDFTAVTASFDNGIYITLGFYGDEADGEYYELGYGTTVAEIDLGAALIIGSEELSGELDSDGNANEDTALVLSIGKSF